MRKARLINKTGERSKICKSQIAALAWIKENWADGDEMMQIDHVETNDPVELMAADEKFLLSCGIAVSQ
jgi:hypothetical protein